MSIQNSILASVVRLMMYAGDMSNLTGEGKKKYVLDKLRENITLDNVVEDLLIELVDVLIKIENGEIVFNKKIKNNMCCF